MAGKDSKKIGNLSLGPNYIECVEDNILEINQK
jgi:hypothetical protein